jgi:predicted dehydrogenase
MSVRIGAVGVGWWATFSHIPTIQADPRATLVAIADLSSERLAIVGNRFQVVNCYADYRLMIEEQKLDGLIVATPHVAHAEIAAYALAKGLHVLLEKPMATSSVDARAIVREASKAGRQVLVPCGWNFRDYTDKATEIVANGRIGKIRHIVCQMASALGDLFAGEPMIETTDHLFRPPPSTWADPRQAGGYGWGQMSHSLAWIYRVADVVPEFVFAMAGKSPTGVDYYDAAVVRMANGATMALSGAATVPKHCGFQMDIRIFGLEGMLLFDVERERLVLRRNDGADSIVPITPGEGGYNGALPVHRFIEICAGLSSNNAADAENGARVVETLEALYRSAATGQTERIGTPL